VALLIRIDGKTSSIRPKLRPSSMLPKLAGKAHEITSFLDDVPARFAL
jgi:hypothetical protein